MSRRKIRKNYLKHIRFWERYTSLKSAVIVTPSTIRAHNKFADAESKARGN